MITLETQNNTPFQRKKKYVCPACDKKNKFTKYVNLETNSYINDKVGICDRIDNCGYHYSPKQYFNDNNIDQPKTEFKAYQTKKIIPPSYIENNILKSTQKKYQDNNFVIYLNSIFNKEIVNKLLIKYNIGTSKSFDGGSTIFWQMDINNKIRSGKIIKYNSLTGGRTKNITWVHSLMKLKEFNLVQCLFGEHLINQNNLEIAIVESEKTAIISSIYFPKYNWLASGSLQNLNINKFKALQDKKEILFPDTSKKGTAYKLWNNKAKELSKMGFNCIVSDLLEKNASLTEKEKGTDLADYLTKYSLNEFSQRNSNKILSHIEVDLNNLISLNPLIEKMIAKFNLNLEK